MNHIFIFVYLFVLFLPACAQSAGTKQVSSQEFYQLISQGEGVLLDVRTEREYRNGHIENAGQLNFYAFDFRRRLLLLPKDQPIYLYCNTGYRSNLAARFLIRNGYTKVYNLQRGIMEWNLEYLPVIIDPNAQPDTDDRFTVREFNELIQSESFVLADFYAPWCGPCRQMMPMIDSLKVEYHGRIRVEKVNADASKRLMRELNMVSVPYIVLYHNGEILFEHRGLIERQKLVAKMESVLNRVDSNQ